MKTDLGEIQRLSREREDENWRFRCYLKGSDLSAAKIDAVVHRLYREIAARIDCTSCGNCCRVILPLLTASDIKRMAAHLGMTVKQFRAAYVRTDSEHGNAAEFNAMPCPFLKDNRCSIYECRPRDCRSFPHLHKKDFVFRMNQALNSCSVCPIVFNLYERLKSEFR